MLRSGAIRVLALLIATASAWGHPSAAETIPDKPPIGPFGYSRIQTANGQPAEIMLFFFNSNCGVCHERQFEEIDGSMHSVAHTEPLYRGFSELARKEAGDAVYRFCSGCHSPAGVVTGLIPKQHDPQLPAEAKAGVTCDVCHQISALTGKDGPWGEPGNASIVLQQGLTKFGPSGEVQENRLHTGEKRDFFAKSEFCASCHTVIHPTNGLRIEHTYAEWKSSIYAEKGIQCQDCHMRSVEDAAEVARTLTPVVRKGQSAIHGPQRETYQHFFVGGNANADRLGGGPKHAKMAQERLKSAARLELKTPDTAAAGSPLTFDIVVHNIAAGHNLPTGVTELRQMWVDLRIVDSQGTTIFRSGDLDDRGRIRPGAIWFGAVAADASGKKTYKLWEMAQFLQKKTIPPKGANKTPVTATLPPGLSGSITIEAKLLYRSAPPEAVVSILGNGALIPRTVEMTTSEATVAVR